MSVYIAAIRSLLFYIFYVSFTLVFCTFAPILFGLLPFKLRSKGLTLWNRVTIFLVRVICGVQYNVTGLENVPKESCVIASKHQSAWETYFFQILFDRPLSTILKRELLRVPLFGWSLALMKPIAIDRSSPREALKQVLELGKQRIANDISVLIFPEGTRFEPGQAGKYARSAASIAEACKVPLIPVAHNAGECWSPRSLIIKPGCIDIIIDSPIDPNGKSSKEMTDMLEKSIEGHMVNITGKASR